jgi:hypothetical protein
VTNANGDRVLLNTNGTITASRSISTKRLDLYTTNYVNDGFPTIGMHYQQPDTTPIELDFSVNPSGFVFNNPVQAAGFFGSGAHLTGLDAGAIATGTVDPARLPANVVTNHQAQLTLGNGYGFPTPLPELEFTNATHTAAIAYAADTGLTFANDSPGTGFGTGFWFSHAQLGADDASGLQNLNASQLTSGTVDSARLPPFDPAGAAHDATNGWPWMALEAGGITQDAADLRYDRLNAAHDATNTWPWLVLSDAAGAAATAAQAATNGWPWLAGYAPTTGAVAFVTTAMLTNKIPWTNVLSLTNSQSQTVDMNLREADFETNQGFTFLGLINKSSTNYQSIVVTVRNNGTTNIPISAPPNTTTNGTLPYVATNSGISKVLIEYHPRYNYTNMLVFPLK